MIRIEGNTAYVDSAEEALEVIDDESVETVVVSTPMEERKLKALAYLFDINLNLGDEKE